MKTIAIAGKDYKLKLGLRALALYEQSTGEGFDSVNGLAQTMTLLYCILTAYNPDFRMTFDDFMQEADDIPLYRNFCEWLANEWERINELSAEGEGEAGEVEKKK
jgi:hypothetical protein